jgi:hypothetical protein
MTGGLAVMHGFAGVYYSVSGAQAGCLDWLILTIAYVFVVGLLYCQRWLRSTVLRDNHYWDYRTPRLGWIWHGEEMVLRWLWGAWIVSDLSFALR